MKLFACLRTVIIGVCSLLLPHACQHCHRAFHEWTKILLECATTKEPCVNLCFPHSLTSETVSSARWCVQNQLISFQKEEVECFSWIPYLSSITITHFRLLFYLIQLELLYFIMNLVRNFLSPEWITQIFDITITNRTCVHSESIRMASASPELKCADISMKSNEIIFSMFKYLHFFYCRWGLLYSYYQLNFKNIFYK